jgi:uncharacterized protein
MASCAYGGSMMISVHMTAEFRAHVTQNEKNRAILSRWNRINLPDSWLVAGCLFQTVWNIQAGRRPDAGIKDYDLFYFDPVDLSAAAKAQVQARVDSLLGDLAPYGLDGLYAGTLTPNAMTPYPDLFSQKAASYRQRWDWLRIEPVPTGHVA